MGRQADERMWRTIWYLSRIGPEYERIKKERREVVERTRALLQEKTDARAAMDLCTQCHEPPFTGSRLCFRHTVFLKLKGAGLTKGVLLPTHRKRRERVVKYLWGQYMRVRNGGSRLSEQETMSEAFRIRLGFAIRWGGAKGVIKFAYLIAWVERLAEKHRGNL